MPPPSEHPELFTLPDPGQTVPAPSPARPAPGRARPPGKPGSAPAGWPPAAARSRRLQEVHGRLCALYGCPVAHWGDDDALSSLIGALLSHQTRNRESHAAYRALRERFADWAAVRDAPTEEVRAAIRDVRWPELKAPRLQQVLRAVTARRQGRLDLEFLAGLTSRQARDWLEGLPGVGPKTSAATVSFSRLRMRALPVDSHHHRVAQRLGLIPPRMDEGPAHAELESLLPADWDAQQVYDHHEVLMFHGQRCCHFHRPECGRCVLRPLCPAGGGAPPGQDPSGVAAAPAGPAAPAAVAGAGPEPGASDRPPTATGAISAG